MDWIVYSNGKPYYMLYGSRLSEEDSAILKENKRLDRLMVLAKSLLESTATSRGDADRAYYSVSLLKPVKKYKPFESFGELSLITDKRRAAKLEVSEDGDAHFAVLSKKDYKNVQYKI